MIGKTSQDMKEFILEFFKSLKCKVIEREGKININEVPKDFEDFLGKKAPYVLVFDLDKHKEIENSELIVKGSYFLTAIRDYMRNKGQSSILKLRIAVEDPNKEIKKEINFSNCRLTEVKKKEGKKYLTKLTFLSSCQYLNEKKQFISSIIVANNQIIEVDWNKYELQEGNKEDIEVGEISNQYKIAQRELRRIIEKETKEIKSTLKDKLGKELERLRDHYKQQINEEDEELARCEEKIKLFEGQLEHAYYDKDIRSLKQKIKKYKNRAEELKKEGYEERIKGEERFQIQDEVYKHSLRIDNNLINVSIIYYPSFLFSLLLKKGGIERNLDVSYDALLKKLDYPICDSCKDSTKEINLCANGHVVCKKCLKICPDCKKELCGACLDNKCAFCSKKICKECAIKCKKCDEKFCKEHIKRCSICEKDLCVNCLKRCEACGKTICKEHFKKCSSCDREICERCARKDFAKCGMCSKGVCSECMANCKDCEKVLCKNHAKKCKDCKSVVCGDHLKECSICGEEFCNKCLRKCQGCGRLICKEDTSECKKCGSKICKKCIVYKKALFGILEKKRCVKCIDK